MAGKTVLLSLCSLDHPRLAVEVARAYNNWLANYYCKPYSNRLFDVAALPLQDPDAAALELRRCVKELGFVGGFVQTNVRGMNLSHPMFDVVWAEAERLGVPIGVHTATGIHNIECAGQERFDRFIHTHLCSHPFDQMLAVSSFILDGVLDRFPGFRVAFLEGQASWLSWWLYRIEEHIEKLRPQAFCKEDDPAAYFQRGQCYISSDSDEPGDLLNVLAQTVSENAILYASDYAHWDSNWPEDVAGIAENPKLSIHLKRKVLEENPVRLYKLPVEVAAR